MGTVLEREPLHGLELLVRVPWEAIDGHDRLEPELRHDPQVAREIRGSPLDGRDAAVRLAAVVLEGANRGDEHDSARLQPACPAHDVEKLLHPHVRPEAALRHDVVAELERDEIGDERVVAVGDVRERAAVDERRLAFERLHEVRLDGVLEQHGHGARGAELLRCHGLALPRVGDGDRSQAAAEIVEVSSDGRDRHHLGRRGDVEAGLAHVAVRTAAEADNDAAESAVVHVDASAPAHGERIDAERVAVEDVRLEHRREQVVGGADGVDVAGEVEVEVLHRHDLRVAATRGATLDPEDRAERRLTQTEHGSLADLAQALRERDRRRRLAFARFRRRDGRHADELRVLLRGQPVEHGQPHLRLVVPVELDLVSLQPDVRRKVGDRPQLRGLGDLEAREHGRSFHCRAAGRRRTALPSREQRARGTNMRLAGCVAIIVAVLAASVSGASAAPSAAPPASVTYVEPLASGSKIAVERVAAGDATQTETWRLNLDINVKNTSTRGTVLKLASIRIAYPGSSISSVDPKPLAPVTIAAGASKTVAVPEARDLAFPVAGSVQVQLGFAGYDTPLTVTRNLVEWKSVLPGGAYLFPGKREDLPTAGTGQTGRTTSRVRSTASRSRSALPTTSAFAAGMASSGRP